MNTSTRLRLDRLLRGDGLGAFLVRGFIGSGALKVTQALLALAMAILLARTLGPEGYGIYAFAFSLASMIAVPAQMGLPTLVVREVARYQLNEEWGHLRGLLRRANQAVYGLTLVCILCAVGWVWTMGGHVDETERETFVWALMLVPLIALGNLRDAALRGLRNVVQGQLAEMLLRPAFLLAFAAIALRFGELTPQGAMMVHGLAAALAFAVGLVLLSRAMPPQVSTAQPSYETEVWSRAILPLSFISGMLVINGQADIVMLGLLTSSVEVGVYRVAVQGAILAAFTLTIVTMVIAPQITRLYQAGDIAKLQRMVTVSVRTNFFASLLIALVFLWHGRDVIGLVFGPGYVEAYVPLLILSFGNVLFAIVGLGGLVLTMSGHERLMARGMAISAVLNIVGNLVFIPHFGMAGAAWVSVLSLMSVKLYLWVKALEFARIDSSVFSRHKNCW